MNQTFRVAWREYRTRVSSPLFIILTLVTFVLLVGGTALAEVILNQQSDKPTAITVIDRTGWMAGALAEALSSRKEQGDTSNQVLVELKDGDPSLQDSLMSQAKAGDIPGLLVLNGQSSSDFSAAFYTNSVPTLARMEELLNPLVRALVQMKRLQEQQIDPAILVVLQQPVAIQFVQVSTGEESGDYGVRVGIAMAFNALMYIGILMYATLTFQGVLEEKTSRIMEVLVAAVKPTALLTGKIIGIGLVGLTQFLTWVLAYTVLLHLPLEVVPTALGKVNGAIMGYMVLYFVAGYFLFASLFAAAASTVSRLEDSQGVMAPLMVPVFAGYMISIVAVTNPTGALTHWSSLIPFLSPTVMVTRLTLTNPPVWEIVLSLALLVATTVGAAWVAGRIYRVGVLMYGAKPSWRSLLHYVKAS